MRRVELWGGCTMGLLCAVVVGACGGEPNSPPPPVQPADVGIYIEEEPQRDGDAAAGYHALVHEGYVGCGVPMTAFSQVFGPAPENQRLPDREGDNADMAYVYNVYTTAEGVKLVAPNCLSCHASMFQGQVIVGLGEANTDFTVDNSQQVALAGFLLSDPAEKAELAKFAERAQAIGPHTTPDVIGPNPAENIAAVLIAHRDRETLAWSAEPLLELPPDYVLPVDVPPWWRMKKKHAMFYVAAGRGDHARIMMTASTLCVDDVEQARAIDAYFTDVRAFINSIEPPAYPYPVDQALAETGRGVFEATCSRCHGSYSDDAAAETYPNLLIPLTEIRTDDALAGASANYADDFVDWYNGSFYGEISRVDPQEGYVAPPLDGIWATAPFLHNGSVPTVLALLDSTRRPTYWSRTYNTEDYDPAALGWNYTELEEGHAAAPDANAKKRIYDTTELGYKNTGHTYGDGLDEGSRLAVIEYLKTL